MAERRRARLHSKRTSSPSTAGILNLFNCKSVSYNIQLDSSEFDQKAFSGETKIDLKRRWSAGIYPKDKSLGYHVHFNGHPVRNGFHIEVEYLDGSYSAPKHDEEPFAETIMRWFGSFLKGEKLQPAMVFAEFEKPSATWRSRVNLPFKVTVVDAEVTIDGLSIEFPKNRFKAIGCFLMPDEESILANLQIPRTIEFEGFNLKEDLEYFDQAVRLIVEPTK